VSEVRYNDDFRRINIDRMLAEHDLDRREHLRVRPSFLTPVMFDWQGGSYKVLDVSRGGFSFVNAEPIDLGWELRGNLRLPLRPSPLAVTVVVVGSAEDGLVRCRFEDLGEEALEMLGSYVRERSRELTDFYFKQIAPLD
jgi:hypothetical protein